MMTHHLHISVWCLGLLFAFLCIADTSHAQIPLQDSIELTIIPSDSLPLDVHLNFIKYFPTTDSCRQYLSGLPVRLMAYGYIAASVDTVLQLNPKHLEARLYLGAKYRWKSIQISATDRQILENLGIRTDQIKASPVQRGSLNRVFQALLGYYLSNGYPFASIGLDSVQFEQTPTASIKGQAQTAISARLFVNKGTYYTFDTIVIHGSAKVSDNFLHHYLSIQSGEAFNQSKLGGIDRLLHNLPYVEMVRPSAITMLNNGAVLNVYLDKKLTNQVDAIIGFMPANGQEGGKLQLTGQVALNLKNAFGGGESLDINWQQLQPQSPRIDLAFQRPYLFKSPFGIDLAFGLYKKDSVYVNAFGNIGAIYQFSAMRTGRVFLNLASSRILDVDTLEIIATHQLPEIMDVSSMSVGFGYSDNTTDYQFNPRRGSEFSATALVGNKKVKKNNAITKIQDPDGFDYGSLYDTVKLKGYQIQLTAGWAHYFPMGKFSVLKTAANGGLYQSPSVFTNEMFLIGGHKLLRGFDEESIYATAYGVGSLEYRYLIGRNSFFFGFSDFGWSQFKNGSRQNKDTYLSFGLGMAFETKAGIFNFSIATGKDKENSFGLNKAKVHIGYTTLF